jgi:hypothetical protein
MPNTLYALVRALRSNGLYEYPEDEEEAVVVSKGENQK